MHATTPERPSTDDVHRLAAAARAGGSLKWTAVDADIAAWVAESDLGTAPAVLEAVRQAVTDGLLGYLPPTQRRELAEATAAWHVDRYGWAVPPERIHPTADVLEALRTTVDHFTPAGSAVIVPTPAYMPFLTAPQQWGRQVLQVPMPLGEDGSYHLDLEALAEAFRTGGHLLVLTNPHNPTGRVMTVPEMAALADLVEKHGGRVFSDEIHAPLVHPGHRHVPFASVSPAAAARTITATSASKAWNVPGLKCAQILLSDDDDVDAWRPIDHLATHGASTLGVIANTVAYREGGAWLDGVLRALSDHRSALAEGLALGQDDGWVGYRPPEGTYLAWLDLRRGFSDASRHGDPLPEDLGAWVRRRTGVAVVDGAACGWAGRGFVRLNLAMPRPLVVEAGRRIAAATAPGAPFVSAPGTTTPPTPSPPAS